MKKLLYSVFFVFILVASVTACTEEEVTPKSGHDGIGHAIRDKI